MNEKLRIFFDEILSLSQILEFLTNQGITVKKGKTQNKEVKHKIKKLIVI